VKKLMLKAFCFLAMGGLSVQATAKPTELTWDDLVPPVQEEMDNPFDRLNEEQLDALRRMIRLEWIGDSESKAESASIRAGLGSQGLDVEGLLTARENIIQAREAMANQVNSALLGQEVRLPGYILPLEMKDRKAVEFLLVPTVGACIHTPPPPPNQMVHVVHQTGVEVKGLYHPVWLTGVLEAETSVQKVVFSDGQAQVPVSYAMRPDRVEPY
jgi:hypothetical protein